MVFALCVFHIVQCLICKYVKHLELFFIKSHTGCDAGRDLESFILNGFTFVSEFQDQESLIFRISFPCDISGGLKLFENGSREEVRELLKQTNFAARSQAYCYWWVREWSLSLFLFFYNVYDILFSVVLS